MKHQVVFERQELFDVNMIIAMTFDVKGEVSSGALQEAFAEAVKCNEILNTKVVIEPDGSAFYVSSDEPESRLIITEEDLDEVRMREERIRFRIEEGEYIRAFVNLEEGGMKLLLLMHHMGGDGKSLLYFAEDLLRSLGGETLQFKEIRTAEPKGKLDPISRAIIRSYNRKWNGHVFTFPDMDEAYRAYWKDRKTTVEVEVLEEEETAKIREECRKAGAKFTAYLIARLIKDTKGKQDVGLAADYRHDGNRSMGNQASGTSVVYQYDTSKSIYMNAAAIQKKLDKKLKSEDSMSYILNFMGTLKPTLVDAVNLEHAGAYSDKTSAGLAKLLGFTGKTKDLSITNLTVADIPVVYGSFKLERIEFTGPVVSYGKNVVGVITCNGKTVITRHRRTDC